MSKHFYVCKENGLKELLKNRMSGKSPKIYMAGYTEFSNWVYEDYSPDSDYCNERFYVIDYYFN